MIVIALIGATAVTMITSNMGGGPGFPVRCPETVHQ
jgi:hypothetical protein